MIDPLEQDAPALFSMTHDEVYLDFEDAKAFQKELHDLTWKYIGRGGGQRHLVRIAFSPLPEEAKKIP